MRHTGSTNTANAEALSDPVSKTQVPFFHSVFVRLNLGFALLLIIMVVLTFIMVQKIARPQIESQLIRLASKTGDTVIAELEKHLTKSEMLAAMMANAVENMPLDKSLYFRQIPNLINLKSEREFIAGGGIWPEPYRFNKNEVRRSFFWGREKSGELKFYDDYNAPESDGYHNQEWYVPAKTLPQGKGYWSQAYTDPYTNQPMVTTTIPMYRKNNKNIYGVATIDIKLDGLRSLIEKNINAIDGYSFLLDRFGNVVFSPRDLKIKKQDGLSTSAEITKKYPQYAPIFKFLKERNRNILARVKVENKGFQKLSARLNKNIKGVKHEQAEILAAQLLGMVSGNEKDENFLKKIDLENDPLIHEPVTALIFTIPDMDWNFILLLPRSQTLNAVKDIIRTISRIQLIILLLALSGGAALLYILVVKPLQVMTNELDKSSKSETQDLIKVTGKDEISRLAAAFNNRTLQLIESIDKIKQAEKDKSEQLEKFSHSINDALITIDGEGKIMHWNNAATNIFGYEEQEVIGQNISLIIPDSLKERHDKGVMEAAKTKKLKNEDEILEFPSLTKSGEALMLEVSLSTGLESDKRYFTAVIRDISERKRFEADLILAKRQADEANRSKSEFLSNMSHELRTPMHAILSFSNFGIKRLRKVDLEKLGKYFHSINDSGERLLRLLNDLLDLSKLEAGHMEMEFEKNNIINLLESCTSEVQLLCDTKHLNIETNLEVNTPFAVFDFVRLGQVMTNLLSNAIKFSPEHRTIVINVTDDVITHNNQQMSAMHIVVVDSGPGIPEKEFLSVFGKFIQSSKTLTGAGGTGLGLSICMEIIAAHNGKIWVENVADDSGAAFHVLLPVNQVQLNEQINNSGKLA